MTTTADHLTAAVGKAIVLTGAMQPARMTDSDAAFNLGLAVVGLQIPPHGVPIAMSGRLFSPARRRRITIEGRPPDASPPDAVRPGRQPGPGPVVEARRRRTTTAASSAEASAFMAFTHAASSAAGSSRNRKSTIGTISESSAIRVCASSATSANALASYASGRHGTESALNHG
jgi:Asparaginase, N-terminal